MRRSRFIGSTHTFARLLSYLLLAFSVLPLGAQPVPEIAGQGFGPIYDAAHETTLIGTIQEVVIKHIANTPAGLHLLVAGPDGAVDAHLGSLLSTETKDSLRAGMPVQIVGAPTQLGDKEYFLARELTVNGRTITIRNARGFLVQPRADRVVQTKGTVKADTNGDAR